jgi:peptide/nickel transport system permease protein
MQQAVAAPDATGRNTSRRLILYLVRTLVKLVLTLFAISVVVFGLTALAGNPAHDILGMYATKSQLAAFTRTYQLNDPVFVRYARWLGGVLHGNFGKSYVSGGSVWALIEPCLGRSLLLISFSWVLIVAVSVPAGLLTGVRLRGRADVAATLVTLIVAAFPEFVIGMLLIIVFAVNLKVLPVDSTALDQGSLLASPSAYVLPAITIALVSIPYPMRLMRANARDVASHAYVRSAVLRGISEPALSVRHIFPNAAPPVVTALGLQLASLVGGVIVVETLFGFPGIGQLLVQSAASRDAPTVEALTMMIGTAFVIINIASDVLIMMLTPKLRDTVR